MPKLATVWLVVIVLAGCATRPSGPSLSAAEARLGDLMAERLEVSRCVAWFKFQNNLPVRDAAREAEVVANFVADGTRRGLPESRTQPYITAQIRASRLVQQELIAGWRHGGTLPAYPPWDLKRHVRPRLDRIGREMLETLGQVGRSPTVAAALECHLRTKGFSWFAARAAVAPLR
jgi:chorismate mutase-like protein